MNELLSAKQVSDICGVTPKTVYKWVREKQIPCIILPGGTVRFYSQAIENWLTKRTIKSKV